MRGFSHLLCVSYWFCLISGLFVNCVFGWLVWEVGFGIDCVCLVEFFRYVG